MRNAWYRKLFCAMLIAALLTQCMPVALAAQTEPELYRLVGGEPDEDGNWTNDYWVDSHGNRLDEHTPRVRAAESLPSQYDLRDQGLVTPVRYQAGSGSCWVFGAIGSLESSYIKQGYGTAEDTDYSEAHLAWFASRRPTDETDPMYGDGLTVSNPFLKGGNSMRASGALMRGSGLQLEENAPWIATYDREEMMQMQQDESDRYVSYARMWKAQSIRDNSAETLKRKIMQNGAACLSYYDDNDSTRLGYNRATASYYQNVKTDMTNHTVLVVGWDDAYPLTNFNDENQPSSDGAWLVKGSWSTGFGDQGYYWISYEDTSLAGFSSFVAAPAEIYDHIYQYDGASPSLNFKVTDSGKMANVFTAQRTELLTHVALFSANAAPIKATAEVYVAPEGFVYTGSNPVSGFTKIDAATTTAYDVEYGYTTIALAEPTLLRQGQTFSVVLTMERTGSDVYVPIEGYTVAEPAEGVTTYSGDAGTSFFGYGGNWYDTNRYNGIDYNNVPLKAMTRDVTPEEPALAVTAAPDKTTYRVGDALDTTGLTLGYTDAYGLSETVTTGFSCDPTELSAIGTQTVTVTYKDAVTSFDVTVEPYECALELLSPPDKTTYSVGDTLDTAGLVLLYSDEYGEMGEVTEGFSCDPSTLFLIGTQTVRVTYRGLSVTFDVRVDPYQPTLTVKSAPEKTCYIVGETLDTTGLTLEYKDEYGRKQTVSEGFECTPQTLQTLGTQTVTVTYNGVSASFDVTVEQHELTLAIFSLPTKTTYLYGETLDTSGLILVYTDRNGVQYVVTEGYRCEPSAFYALGTQTVTVMYSVLSVTFDVTVEPYTPTLSLLTPPDKTAYLYGETLDTAGLTLRYMDMYGEAHTVTEGYDCTPDVLQTLGTQTVTVTCNGLSAAFDVTVGPHTPTLTLLSAPDAAVCIAGQTPDLAGLTLSYTDEYGEAHTVREGYTCAPTVFRALGTQTATVTYRDLSVTFDMTVQPAEPTLALQFLPEKTNYMVGETIDTTGLTLFYTNETADALMVTEGFTCDPGVFTSAGSQTVTVTFRGLSVTFDVTVQQTGLFLVADVQAHAGQTVDVAVRIQDNPGIIATLLEITYDRDVLTLEGVQNGDIFPAGHFTPGNDLTALPFRVLFEDSLTHDDYTQTGVLVVFRFRVRTDAQPGESEISLRYDADSTYDVDVHDVSFRVQNGTCTVLRSPGDVNGDGLIDLKDVVILRRYLAGWGVTVNMANADVDQKEGVNLKDVTCICRYLAGGYDVVLL